MTDDYPSAARAVLDAVPALLRQAEAIGAVALARCLGRRSARPRGS